MILLFRMPRSWAAVSHGSGAAAKGRKKFISTKIQRNPLKMLDWDERIQENPSFSNLHKRGFSQRIRDEPRKPQTGRRGPRPTPPKCKAVWMRHLTLCSPAGSASLA
jgi:hypothetical protein